MFAHVKKLSRLCNVGDSGDYLLGGLATFLVDPGAKHLTNAHKASVSVISARLLPITSEEVRENSF